MTIQKLQKMQEDFNKDFLTSFSEKDRKDFKKVRKAYPRDLGTKYIHLSQLSTSHHPVPMNQIPTSLVKPLNTPFEFCYNYIPKGVGFIQCFCYYNRTYLGFFIWRNIEAENIFMLYTMQKKYSQFHFDYLFDMAFQCAYLAGKPDLIEGQREWVKSYTTKKGKRVEGFYRRKKIS